MGRRLEKYHLFCNTAFFSLFTIKFVRYIFIYDKIHSKVGTKKLTKYIVNFRYISETSYICMTNTLLSRSKKAN